MKECLNCGFIPDRPEPICPKCDSHLNLQTDKTWIRVDVAHHGETIDEAINTLRKTIIETRMGNSQGLNVVVGKGMIRDAAWACLKNLKDQRKIITFDFENKNDGMIKVQVK